MRRDYPPPLGLIRPVRDSSTVAPAGRAGWHDAGVPARSIALFIAVA